MFNKLGTRHCFWEMRTFGRCFNLSFYLAACLCEFRKIIFWSTSATCTCSRSSHLAAWPHNAHVLNQEAAWVQVTWTTLPDKWHSGEQATEPRSMDNSVGGWLGEWVSVTWHFLLLLVLASVPTILDPLSTPYKLPVLFWLLQHPIKRHSSCIPVGICFFSLCKVSAVSHPLMCCPSHTTCVGYPFGLQCACQSNMCKYHAGVIRTGGKHKCGIGRWQTMAYKSSCGLDVAEI